MQRNEWVSATLVLCVGLVGCGDDKQLNIGEVGVLGASLTDYAGTWEGYAEAYEFIDGSDDVRVLLNDDGVGVVEVGNTAPLPDPVATDGYPPSGSFETGDDGVAFFEGRFTGALVPGFSYPIEAAIIEDSRIRFEASTRDLYTDWCTLLAPIHDELNSNHNGNGEVFSCLPNGGFGSKTENNEEVCYLVTDTGEEPIACGLLGCVGVCECDAAGCFASDYGPDVRFDGALQGGGDELEGTLLLGSERITVRLDRQ